MLQGKLVAKYGGAYMSFDEFMKYKAESEMVKIDELIEKREWDQEGLIQYYLTEINPSSNQKGRASP